LISLGNGVEGARTLLPDSVSFQLYKLTITPVAPTAGETTTQDISSGTSVAIELAPGTWEIHADAYTDTEGKNKAAEGDSKTFTVSLNQTTPVNITLAAIDRDGTGTLSVNISGAAGVISHAYLSIYGGPDFDVPVSFEEASDQNYADFSSSGVDLDISLPAGQYRVAAQIDNTEGQRAYINEVAYIYNYLTTRLEKLVEAADFIDVAAISGTVRYQENNLDQDGYLLAVYANPEGTGFFLDEIYIPGAGSQPYTLRVPVPDKDVTLYFYILRDNRFYAAGSLDLADGQRTATKEITATYTTITLSGGIGTVTVNGETPKYVGIYAYDPGFPEVKTGRPPNLSRYGGSVDGDSWEISGIPGNFTGTLTIGVEVAYNGRLLQRDITTWKSGSPTTDIGLGNVVFDFITLSGSIGTVTVNGEPQKDVDIYARASKDTYWGSTDGDSWEISGIPSDFTGTLTISVEVNYNDSWLQKDIATWTSGSSFTINLEGAAFSVITLSGSIGTVTVNGEPLNDVIVYARASLQEDYYWGSSTDGNSWKINITPGDFTGELAIGVEVKYNDTWLQKDIATWTSGSSSATDNITLGNVNITLNPIGGTVTGVSSGSMYIASASATKLSDLFNQIPLGSADIINGDFSGYVLGDVDSGYVFILAVAGGGEDDDENEPGKDEPVTDEPGREEPGKDNPGTGEPGKEEPGKDNPGTGEPGKEEPGMGNSIKYYITPGKVILGTSMRLDISSMIQVVDDLPLPAEL
jgi:hypothetical protein